MLGWGCIQERVVREIKEKYVFSYMWNLCFFLMKYKNTRNESRRGTIWGRSGRGTREGNGSE